MKKLLTILFVFFAFTINAQNFLKYSTFYISIDLESPLSEESNYMMDRTNGQLTDLTIINPFSRTNIML